eukprot:7815046-Prorocentrum_lima.AAC.1
MLCHSRETSRCLPCCVHPGEKGGPGIGSRRKQGPAPAKSKVYPVVGLPFYPLLLELLLLLL